jgi:metal-responsive CopG/Arc/MetJ family transcriptional regulator
MEASIVAHLERRSRERRPAAPGSATKRIIVEFPPALYRITEEAVREWGITRSALVRAAVERYVKELKRQRRERELAAGYAANAALDREICGDFSYVDAENI